MLFVIVPDCIEQALGMAGRAGEVRRIVDDQDGTGDPLCIAEPGGVGGVIPPLAEPGAQVENRARPTGPSFAIFGTPR
ncbi:MAG: hypothetical protein K0U61_04350 [Alphaproteobacteria bacterium]|nr:hypothetical protein [Alphaproteobacteria bacterium]